MQYALRCSVSLVVLCGLLSTLPGCAPSKPTEKEGKSGQDASAGEQASSEESKPLVRQIAAAPLRGDNSSSSRTSESNEASSTPSDSSPSEKSNKVQLGSDPELLAGIPGQGSLTVEEIAK